MSMTRGAAREMTPIKCFRVLTSPDGSATIWVEDWADQRMLYAITMNSDATHWVSASLGKAHKVPVIDYAADYPEGWHRADG